MSKKAKHQKYIVGVIIVQQQQQNVTYKRISSSRALIRVTLCGHSVYFVRTHKCTSPLATVLRLKLISARYGALDLRGTSTVITN